MKKSKKAASVMESILALLILSLGIIGLFAIYGSGINLTTATKNRIAAIQICRDGLEAFSNIRDTNWLNYASDYTNCWNVNGYNDACIGDDTFNNDISSGSYIIYSDTDNRWQLDSKTSGSFSDPTYISNFRVDLDSFGFYTQGGGITFEPIFTREIQVSYIDTNGDGLDNSNDEKMKVKSIVQWVDSTSDSVHIIEFENILTNWKNVED